MLRSVTTSVPMDVATDAFLNFSASEVNADEDWDQKTLLLLCTLNGETYTVDEDCGNGRYDLSLVAGEAGGQLEVPIGGEARRRHKRIPREDAVVEAIRLGKPRGLQDMKVGDVVGLIRAQDVPGPLQVRPGLGFLSLLEAFFGLSVTGDRLFRDASIVDGKIILQGGAYIPLGFCSRKWCTLKRGQENKKCEAFTQVSVGVFPRLKPQAHQAKMEVAMSGSSVPDPSSATFADCWCGRTKKQFEYYRGHNPRLIDGSMSEILDSLVDDDLAISMACGCVAVAVFHYRV